MSEYPIYQVDAFAEGVFAGNPAAVVIAAEMPPVSLMISIAAENNLPETAFVVPAGADRFDLRWFTPTSEVELCGHATLATAHALWTEWGEGTEVLTFATRSGDLTVRRGASGYALSLPADRLEEVPCPGGLAEALGATPLRVMGGLNFYAVYDDRAAVEALRPDFRALASMGVPAPHHPRPAIGVTARGGAGMADFVSRFFAPMYGIDEDPVTGSAHAGLAPYWGKVLGKDRLVAEQVSARGGQLICALDGPRVTLEGRCVTYLRGTIAV